MTTAETALSLLRESRDGSRIWYDNGETITRLAREAGVRVEYVRVDLRALTCERRIVEGERDERGKNLQV